jgi:hypothetical protein
MHAKINLDMRSVPVVPIIAMQETHIVTGAAETTLLVST